MDDVLAALDEHSDLDDLIAWCRIPSVSSDPSRATDVVHSAEHLASELRRHAPHRVEIWPTGGHPAVFAEWKGPVGSPTLLIYGHHDVQPEHPVAEWISPPFEPTVRNGRLYARGAVDDKGQVHLHVRAIAAFVRSRGSLPLHVKLLVEGEEEVGSKHLTELLASKQSELQADLVCVSDTSMFGPGVPSICVGLRGVFYAELHVEGPSTDLHSGSFGGALANPAHALAQMIASLHDDEGHVLVPGFYDDVRAPTPKEREEIAALPFNEAAWLRSTGASSAFGEVGYSTLERLWTRPTLDVCGLYGGHMGAGAKTILPSRVSAKISGRLVADQDPTVILRRLRAHLLAVAPAGVRTRVVDLHGGKPYLAPTGHPAYEAAKRALSKAFGAPAVFVREGASIPFVRTIADALGKPCLLLGFGQPDSNAHAPNEWLDVDSYHRGAKAAALFYNEVACQAAAIFQHAFER
jgi:acetylornithine deacetylase/succinyl-diaminopimelate desuccinylase-like protein